MKQKVMVISVRDGMAQVQYHRPTACHGDCSKCAGGCGSMAAQEEMIVSAENLIGAHPGDSVWIEGETRKVVWAVALVYVIPVLLFFIGYFYRTELGEGKPDRDYWVLPWTRSGGAGKPPTEKLRTGDPISSSFLCTVICGNRNTITGTGAGWFPFCLFFPGMDQT